MTTGVIVPAAGSGVRLGEPVPKAFVDLDGRSILEVCLAGIAATDLIDQVVVVVPAELCDHVARAAPGATVVVGGVERTDSVRAGLAALRDDVDVVLVHDAARPLTPVSVFRRVVDAVRAGSPAVIPGIPVVDTLKSVTSSADASLEQVDGTVDRDGVRAVQTPQGFDRTALVRAYAEAGDIATDDAGLAERAGIPVHVVAGDPLALKITTPWDLRIARSVLADPAGRTLETRA
ncbi:2-C-methyl-D-erythritol 4-phosphate cytidylyltransferase [Gordonia soli]|uniref:2-C-methyl-D-erythritol 4-phosphate cytidylyltransferase n=1 Tax=Gordonia soli NBRC 108243 TaxID=1223545 RepID=M0QHD4_9ACTN|nr:2-C-methyl-D-erythritol 4-phosphate cytidylyltransferase [Gordonia soli]GAC68050.1 2-C-methyl-D-erythritol 4-phosphate cytidylyltransferase [Gordonia soli NBRC 108243]